MLMKCTKRWEDSLFLILDKDMKYLSGHSINASEFKICVIFFAFLMLGYEHVFL